MSDENDSQNYALMLVAGVVAVVIAIVIGLAARASFGGSSLRKTSAETALSAVVANRPAGRVDFEVGSVALPPNASEILVQVADAARMDGDKRVLISSFHDANGDAATNAELARKRAFAVRHALEANGVAPDRLLLDPPTLANGEADPREARRVEIRLR